MKIDAFTQLNIKMNSKIIGDTFRDYVFAILKSKFLDAHTEGKASWKNADIIFSMMELGKRIKVAVECKNYSRALNTSDFSKITADYKTAVENNDIDLVLVVSNRHVESASRQYIEKTRSLRFMTVAELESWLVGLQPYVQALSDEFAEDEIHEYYVEGRFEGIEGTAFEDIKKWITSEVNEETGLAVLGGYGLGKSSLAKRLASDQAQRYLRDPENERLPILLPLGHVVHETELAGLFGKHFTSRYSLEGYSYKSLMQLNLAGRLLIILDGFDEMKHAMTEHDFRSNFREFNKLRSPKSKILLLGRPNVFTSESSNLLIRGLSKLGDQPFLNSDFPAWSERRLSFFNIEEQRLFLDGFLKSKSPMLADNNTREARINEVLRDIDDDILQRPVQTRIVGLLAADPKYIFKETSRYQLYNDFVQQVIHRDQEKRARSFIPAADRHRFLCSLAWWSWTRPGVQGTFVREEVPKSLMDGLSDGLAIDYQSKRTEYLVSSLTEEKDSNFLYFAHRSFHEFLVASHITSLEKIPLEKLKEIGQAMNDDIIDFLQESKEENYLNLIYAALNEAHDVSIGSKLIELLSSSGLLVKYVLKKTISKITPFDVFIVWKSGMFPGDRHNFQKWLGKIILSGENSSADAAGFIFLEYIYLMPEVSSHISAEFLSYAWERVLSGLSSDGWKIHVEELHDVDIHTLVVKEGKFCAIADALRKQTRKMRLLKGDWILINVKEIYSILTRSLKMQGFLDLSESREIKLIEIPCQSVEKNMERVKSEKFKAIYERKGDEFLLVRGSNRSKNRRTIKPQAEDVV